MRKIHWPSVTASVASVLLSGAAPAVSFAAGVPGPPPVIMAPSVGTPAWTITVPVQLASIPSRYPRFSVVCTVWSAPPKNPQLFQNPNPVMIGSGKQDWSLNPNGDYTGSIIVRVFLLQQYPAWLGQGGSYNCYLRLLDASNQVYDVGPYQDPSLRPQQGTPFVPQVGGTVP